MRFLITFLILFLSFPCYAQEPKVYTDQDLKKYKSESDSGDYKREDSSTKEKEESPQKKVEPQIISVGPKQGSCEVVDYEVYDKTTGGSVSGGYVSPGGFVYGGSVDIDTRTMASVTIRNTSGTDASDGEIKLTLMDDSVKTRSIKQKIPKDQSATVEIGLGGSKQRKVKKAECSLWQWWSK